MRRVLFIVFLMFVSSLEMWAQQYTGLSGLIHIPSAEMNAEGDARIGIHFLNKKFTPGHLFSYEGNKYNTFSYYLSITPFKWIELGYTCTYIKRIWNTNSEYYGEKAKDRYFSLKLNPIQEREWWPSVALGCNDVSNSYSIFNTDDEAVEAYFGNYYVAASKHVHINRERIGIHINDYPYIVR